MYKLLLCLRYVRTRYIALASIISVMLGVATMIVVNSVMSGFQNEMVHRLHGILSDIVVEAHSLEGIQDPDKMMSEIRNVLGDDIVAMTPSVQVPAMISFQVRGEWMIKQVNLIGVDPATCADVSDFSQYLLHPQTANRSHSTCMKMDTEADCGKRAGRIDENGQWSNKRWSVISRPPHR